MTPSRQRQAVQNDGFDGLSPDVIKLVHERGVFVLKRNGEVIDLATVGMWTHRRKVLFRNTGANLANLPQPSQERV